MIEKTRLIPLLSFFLVILVFILLEIVSAGRESLTWDEIGHYQEGLAALTKNHFTISPNSPTFVPQLSALPTVFGLNKLVESKPYPSDQLIFSRLVIILLTVFIAISIYFFALSLFDQITALLSVIFFLFEPTIFAHAHYITLDIGFTLLFFLAYWLFFLFINKPSYLLGIPSGFSLGLVIASKVTGIGFFAIIILFFTFLRKKLIKKKMNLSYFLLFFISVLAGIWFTYRFTYGTLGGFTEGGFRFSNKIYNQLHSYNSYIADVFRQSLSMPLPLGDFPRILKNAYVFNLNAKSAFFLGKTRESSGLLMLLLFILKTPIPLLILFILGIKRIYKEKNLLVVLIPLMSVFIFVFFSKIDLRLRYLMPLYPFLAIIAARGVSTSIKRYKRKRLYFLLLIIWFLLSIKVSFPYAISYANEASNLLGKPYLIFSDSNIDWGQGLIVLKDYVDKNKVGRAKLSYYGTDDPNKYGFRGFAKENICKKSCFIDSTHTNSGLKEKEITAISITNWQECGFYKTELYLPSKIKDVLGGSILVFN